MLSLGLYVQHNEVSNAPSFVFHVIYIPYLPWSLECDHSKPHPFGKGRAYKIVCGTGVHEYFDVSHGVIRLNGHWDSHRLKAHDYYRITMDCPHPGQWVQVF